MHKVAYSTWYKYKHKRRTLKAQLKYHLSSMSKTEEVLKIPTNTLPKDWQSLGAEKFKLSAHTVSAIVNGKRRNDEVFTYMLELAETEKQKRDQEAKKLKARLANLSK